MRPCVKTFHGNKIHCNGANKSEFEKVSIRPIKDLLKDRKIKQKKKERICMVLFNFIVEL